MPTPFLYLLYCNTTSTAVKKFSDINLWLSERTPLPIWWSEWYPLPEETEHWDVDLQV